MYMPTKRSAFAPACRLQRYRAGRSGTGDSNWDLRQDPPRCLVAPVAVQHPLSQMILSV